MALSTSTESPTDDTITRLAAQAPPLSEAAKATIAAIFRAGTR